MSKTIALFIAVIVGTGFLLTSCSTASGEYPVMEHTSIDQFNDWADTSENYLDNITAQLDAAEKDNDLDRIMEIIDDSQRVLDAKMNEGKNLDQSKLSDEDKKTAQQNLASFEKEYREYKNFVYMVEQEYKNRKKKK